VTHTTAATTEGKSFIHHKKKGKGLVFTNGDKAG
jgi:hypothetical protein